MLSHPVSDEELVGRCAAGSKAAWDAFTERYAKLIRWSIRRSLVKSFLGNDSAAHDEIFQKVFERLLDKDGLTRLRQVSSLRQFLVVMAGRMAMDKLKEADRARRRFARPQDELGSCEDAPAASSTFQDLMDHPDAAAEAAEREKRLIFCEVFDELSEKEKSCMEYCYLDGKSHREIAQVLELQQDTVSTIIRRTKEKLRKRLLESGFSELL